MRFYITYVSTKKVVELKPITENNGLMTPVISSSENYIGALYSDINCSLPSDGHLCSCLHRLL